MWKHFFSKAGSYTVNARATDINGHAQEETDPDHYDGNNDWPLIRVTVE